MSNTVDLFLTYHFLKRLSTPFTEWDAFKLGIIDETGKVLRKAETLTKADEINAWGYFDRLVANLKKLLAKVPGGKTKIASYAAALLLIKENNNNRDICDDDLETLVEELFNEQLRLVTEDGSAGIVNNVGSGNIAGLGVGPQGEPPVKKKTRINTMFKRKMLDVDPKLPT